MNRDLRTVTGWIKAEWPGRAIPDAVHDAACRLAGTRRDVKPQRRQRLAAKKESREERNARMAAIREAVFARAGNRCEAWFQWASTGKWHRCTNEALVCDHWMGGVGRRQAEEGVETCWVLCGGHDMNRTANYPDAQWWNESRRHFCAEEGLPFVPHYDARAASRTTAAQPKPSPQTRRDRVTKASEVEPSPDSPRAPRAAGAQP